MAEAAVVAAVEEPAEQNGNEDTDLLKFFESELDACKKDKRDFITEWSTNIDYRRGKNESTDSDTGRSPIAIDWAYTKSKAASLFSQLPQLILGLEEGADSAFKAALPVLARRVNFRLKKAKTGRVMNEIMADVINAAGVGAVIVSYDARTESRLVPPIPPELMTEEQQQQIVAGLLDNTPVSRTFVTDKRFAVKRISPGDLLWPVEFTGSDFDDAPWIGRTGRVTWAEAKRMWNLQDTDREQVSGDDRTSQDFLVDRSDRKRDSKAVVAFDEVFYWRHRFHPDEPSYTAIQHMVFLKGRKTPVVNEPWRGQRYDEVSKTYIGACKFPIRLCTVTYISDEAIPPSDSAVGRPIVDEMIESRQNMREQRKHSIPYRWVDVNRVNADVREALLRGDWQGIIPVNGDGSRVIGEVARATYPRENHEIDRIMKGDLQEAWKTGNNQNGTMANSGEHSATESKIVQNAFATQIGYERAQVVEFFCGIAEVMAGFVVLFDSYDATEGVTPQDQEKLQALNLKRLNLEATFNVRADSTVLLDSSQRYDRLDGFLNKTGQSGYVNMQPIIEEMAALVQLDPERVVITPTPKAPEPPNISFRFSGDDLHNPAAVAILMKADMFPKEEEMSAVFKAMSMMQLPPAVGAAPPTVGEAPPLDPTNVEHPEFGTMNRIEKREAGRSAQ